MKKETDWGKSSHDYHVNKETITMTIKVEKNRTDLTISLEGRLDTVSAPELEKKIGEVISDITVLTFNLEKLEYISSAGLRVLLSTQKLMNRQGKMKVTHVSAGVMEIFEVTGFSDILTIVKG